MGSVWLWCIIHLLMVIIKFILFDYLDSGTWSRGSSGGDPVSTSDPKGWDGCGFKAFFDLAPFCTLPTHLFFLQPTKYTCINTNSYYYSPNFIKYIDTGQMSKIFQRNWASANWPYYFSWSFSSTPTRTKTPNDSYHYVWFIHFSINIPYCP